jgi:anaerobic selenocysteine-containing dehydrogenase
MASSRKSAREHSRSLEVTVETACPLDCPDSCSLSVRTSAGRVLSLDGSRRQPTTAGYICAKVRRFAERVYGADRVQYPMIRSGPKGKGGFTRVGWDEALNTVASILSKIRERWGGEAILPFSYGGSNGLVSQDTTDAVLFSKLGASRLARTVCAAPTGAALEAMYGRMASVAYDDYVAARLIVIWGANPSVSGIHLVPYIREARKLGARLVVIDPRHTPLARLADVHLPIRPGTDLAVALAVHRVLFERGAAGSRFVAEHTTGGEELRERAAAWTLERAAGLAGIPVEDLQRFADLYAATSPAVIRCGWGVERNRNGGNAVLAILALPAVGAKFGVRGGGYTMSSSGAWNIGTRGPADPGNGQPRLINMNRLGRVLTEPMDPPVKALFVYNCNPAATIPDQNRVIRGLEREDLFTVVFDQVFTDTAAYADLVLPATTFLEACDITRGYGPLSMQLVQPVIDAVGEARPNAEVFGKLVSLLGDGDAAGDTRGELDVLMQVLDALPGNAAEQLRDACFAVPECGRTPVQFLDVFPDTPDRKAHLFPAGLDARRPLYTFVEDPGTSRHPLALISPATEKTISSTLGELSAREASVLMHPSDAVERGLSDNDAVRVWNDLGEVHCLLTVAPLVRTGTIVLAKGLWRRSTRNGSTATSLVPDTLTDIGDGACFNDARVEVARLEQGAPRPGVQPGQAGDHPR